MKITPDFDSEEFECKCGCGFNSIDIGLVNRLQVIRDILNEPITVDCGCRCPAHNQSVGGEPNSYHLQGMAVDWTVDKESWKQLGRISKLLENWSGGYHYYPDRHFIHIDVGPQRRW